MKIGDRVRYVADPFRCTVDDKFFEGKEGVIDEISTTESNLIFVMFDDVELNEFEGEQCSSGFYSSQFEVIT